MPILATNNIISRLTFRCFLRGDESSCAKLEHAILLLKVSRRLEDLFPVPELKPPQPVGPDPSPIHDIIEDILGQIDPDGSPAILPPKGFSKDINTRLKAATEMRKALQVIIDEIDVDIKSLKSH
jgi:hypothetical protein